MRATSVDLRFKTKQIFEALERGESVELLQRGKVRGRIIPSNRGRKIKVEDHPLFGLEKKGTRSVVEIMDELRRPRHRAV